MTAALSLRKDFNADDLRRLARVSDNANQTRRLLTLAAIYEGCRRDEAAKIGGVGRQIVRDWVARFNAEGPSGLIDRKATGQPLKLKAAQRQALAARVEQGPIPAVDGVVRWRLKDLALWLYEDFGLSLDETTVSRTLKKLGFAKLSARPCHFAQNEVAIEAFKKASPRRSKTSVPGFCPRPA